MTKKIAAFVALLSAVVILSATTLASAEVVANFSDGNDDTNMGANPPTVDSFLGTAGGGWAGPWAIGTNFNPEFAATVVDSSPVNGGGNYLSATLDSPVGSFSQAAVSRHYVDPTESDQLSQPHTISFDFRTDVALSEFGTIEDRYQIFDGINPIQSSTQTSNTWIIAAYGAPSGTGPGGIVGRNWGFINGNVSSTSFSAQTFVDTGMTVTAGVTYHFEVTTDPTNKTWTATISDGANLFQSGTLNWRNRTATAAGGYLHWGIQKTVAAGGDPYQFSLDNIAVSIDTSTSLLGDYNGDGSVNAADYTIWRDTYGGSVTSGQGADGSGNGVIDDDDYDVWVTNFGMSSQGGMGAVSVPEPATAGLALLAIVAGLFKGCRR